MTSPLVEAQITQRLRRTECKWGMLT